tara:strand:- start:363 stop:1193 length:831 start_codon:yes stop_codon:yes gene_type:complete
MGKRMLNEDWVDKCCTEWGHARCCAIKKDRESGKIGPSNGGSKSKKKTIAVSESQLINSIDRIVKEQAAMLGFGNMGGLSLGVSKPSDKYQEMYEDDNTSNTYNVNYMDQSASNQNMEDWEMGEDYSIERGSHGHPHEMDEGGCGDGEMYEGGCGDGEMYEGGCGGGYQKESIANLVRDELLEAQSKEATKWIQGAVKKPGALRKKLGVNNGDKISLEKINQEMRKIKSKDSNKKKSGVQGLNKSDLKTYRQLDLSKTLRGLSKKKYAKEAKRFRK